MIALMDTNAIEEHTLLPTVDLGLVQELNDDKRHADVGEKTPTATALGSVRIRVMPDGWERRFKRIQPLQHKQTKYGRPDERRPKRKRCIKNIAERAKEPKLATLPAVGDKMINILALCQRFSARMIW